MKRKTIRSHKDFFTTPDNPVYAGRYFIVKAKNAVKKDPRYGIIASKRSFKLAVQRNRAKRLLRDWIAANENCQIWTIFLSLVLIFLIVRVKLGAVKWRRL